MLLVALILPGDSFFDHCLNVRYPGFQTLPPQNGQLALGDIEPERWDTTGSPEMAWSFPVGSPGDYEVRFYLRNGFDRTSTPGTRIFNIQVEDRTFPHLTDIDLAA